MKRFENVLKRLEKARKGLAMLILDNGLPILLTGTGAPSGRISGSRLKGTVLYSGGASLYKTKIRFRRKEVKSTPSPPLSLTYGRPRPRFENCFL